MIKELEKRKPSDTEVDEVGNPLASELVRFCKSYRPIYRMEFLSKNYKDGGFMSCKRIISQMENM